MSTVGLDEDEIRKYVRRQLEKDWFADQLNLWQGQVPSRVAQPTPPPLGVIVDRSALATQAGRHLHPFATPADPASPAYHASASRSRSIESDLTTRFRRLIALERDLIIGPVRV